MKTIACGEVVPGCHHQFSAETEDELLAQVGKHAAEVHGLEVTPDLVQAVKAKIVDDGEPAPRSGSWRRSAFGIVTTERRQVVLPAFLQLIRLSQIDRRISGRPGGA